jgi:hypothetical protein
MPIKACQACPVFVLAVLAIAAVATLAWAAGHQRPGRHQRSPLGPVRGDGSGWTEEGISMHMAEDFPGAYRGPEDDPQFWPSST